MAALRHGEVWTRDRVRGYAITLLVFELIGFATAVAGSHGWIVPLDRPNASDFVSYYAAGLLANDGTAALVYDQAAHYAREQQATQTGIIYNFFYYPPVFLFVCAGLARLPYLVALYVFEAVSLASCLVAARRIAGTVPVSLLLAFPAIFWTVGTGQNALLTAALLAAATLTIDTRPLLAGALMGALCYKPHLAVLLPVALAAGRQWRAFAAASASATLLVAASVLCFGWSSWRAFLDATEHIGSVYGMVETKIDVTGLTNAYGFVLALCGDPALAIQLQVIVTIGVTMAVAWVWINRQRLAIRAAVLLAGIPVAAPVVMFYDLMISGMAIAWLVRDGRTHGFLPWQRTGLMVAFVLPLMSGNLVPMAQMLSGPLAATLVFALALRTAIPEAVRRVALAP